jgi:8-oxo-dGTP pyrophosphatase MutT (NUDIX family)
MSSIECANEVTLLPSIAMADDLPSRLAEVLRSPRERGNAAPQMSPELSYGRHAGPPPATAIAAAVMLLLYPRNGRWHIPLTQRPAGLPRHGGQISLPGGRVERGESPEAAAKRELVEELGISEPISLLGRLPDRYVYASDYVITPHVAAIDHRPHWIPDAREVERVVEMPVDVLFDATAVDRMTVERGPLVFHAPCYTASGVRIWGATAVILAELADAVRLAAQERST